MALGLFHSEASSLHSHPKKVVIILLRKSKLVDVKSGSSNGSLVKNPPVNAGDTGSIPGSGTSPEEEVAIHASILPWELSWTEEPGGL